MNTKTGFFSLLSLTILIASCTGAKTATQTSSTNPIFPSWYQMSEFEADSAGYSSGATAIASDSLVAIQRAETAARAQLESHIAEAMEKVRESLEASGSDLAEDPGFIVSLRNAHARAETGASLVNSSSVKVPNGFRGFSVVEITKAKLYTLVEQSFSSNPSYWNELSNSADFKALF